METDLKNEKLNHYKKKYLFIITCTHDKIKTFRPKLIHSPYTSPALTRR